MRSIKDFNYFFHQIRLNKGNNYPLPWIAARFIYWIIRYHSFSDFFTYRLFEKGSRIESILSLRKFKKIHNRLNPPQYRRILEDKYVFDRFFTSFGFPLAKTEGYIANGKVHYINADIIPLEQLIHRNTDCFIKAATMWGGIAVHKLQVEKGIIKIDNKQATVETLTGLVGNDLYVMQDTVYQHAEMSLLNASSVNTIRMATLHDGEQSVNFFNYLRIGINGSLVDNISHGGLGCAVYDDGRLHTTAYDKTGVYATEVHPASGMKFSTFLIPYYQESLELVRKMHNSIHCIFAVGWDVAITESGPVIIEGNPLADLIYEQQLFGGLKDKFCECAANYKSKRTYLK